MKQYNQNDKRNWAWLKRQKYIESSDAIGTGSNVGFELIEKFPIKKVKYNPSFFANHLNIKNVIAMIDEFYPFGFFPIRLDENFNLLDGQHRLKFAELCGLEYLDVWIETNKQNK